MKRIAALLAFALAFVSVSALACDGNGADKMKTGAPQTQSKKT